MLKLSQALLSRGLSATLAHGYGSFFPPPPELTVVKKHWREIRLELADIDLDTYEGHSPVWAFAPKSRLMVRRVALLHPFDFILYTSIILALRDSISRSRLGPNTVFSYRSEAAPANRLYLPSPSWRDFREAVIAKVTDNPDKFIGFTDIADFYPRIYQHRLVNALQAATRPVDRSYIRVLEKMLFRLSEGTSYGIPVGPPASRVLGEAVLIDVDSTLLSYDIDFVRYVDDFVIFADNPQDAEYGLRVLAETLFLGHGLTLQTAKTNVLVASEYRERHLLLHSEKEENRRKLLGIFEDEGYEVTSYEDLDETQKIEVDGFNLSEMLKEALAEGEKVDYREVSFILGRLSALQKPELIPIVLENLDRLYPVAEAVSAFFKRFASLTPEKGWEIGEALLTPIIRVPEARAPDYYYIWILSVFEHHGNWDHAENLSRIFRESSSDAIRRFAALALATSGTRAQAVGMKEYLASGSPLCRTAMLLATAKLGVDERRHLKRSLRLSDTLEKLCVESKI
jgi:Reverse transcriptase (RNA-dependent DNA polymerase)